MTLHRLTMPCSMHWWCSLAYWNRCWTNSPCKLIRESTLTLTSMLTLSTGWLVVGQRHQIAKFKSLHFLSQSPALQQLTSLYVCRSKGVWRDAAILPWLERNVNSVLDKVDAKESIVAEYTQKRSQRYNKAPPKEILRHIVLSDFKEKVPLAPFVNKDTEPILMYDPLPPNDTINIYTRQERVFGTMQHFSRRFFLFHRPIMPSRVLQSRSPFSMFFQSLLPNFNIQEFAAAPAALNDGPNQGPENNAVDGFDGEGK